MSHGPLLNPSHFPPVQSTPPPSEQCEGAGVLSWAGWGVFNPVSKGPWGSPERACLGLSGLLGTSDPITGLASSEQDPSGTWPRACLGLGGGCKHSGLRSLLFPEASHRECVPGDPDRFLLWVPLSPDAAGWNKGRAEPVTTEFLKGSVAGATFREPPPPQCPTTS